jgi:Tol biopolymer transport system component
VSWSPDGGRLLFGLFDPQADDNRLILADIAGQTLTDLCVGLAGDYRGAVDGLYSALWSPDGAWIAVQPGDGLQLIDLAGRARYTVAADRGGLVGWGAWEE